MEVNWGLMRSFGMFHFIHDIMLLDVLSSSETLLVEKKTVTGVLEPVKPFIN